MDPSHVMGASWLLRQYDIWFLSMMASSLPCPRSTPLRRVSLTASTEASAYCTYRCFSLLPPPTPLDTVHVDIPTWPAKLHSEISPPPSPSLTPPHPVSAPTGIACLGHHHDPQVYKVETIGDCYVVAGGLVRWVARLHQCVGPQPYPLQPRLESMLRLSSSRPPVHPVHPGCFPISPLRFVLRSGRPFSITAVHGLPPAP